MRYDLRRDGNLIGRVDITDRFVVIDEDLSHILGESDVGLVATGYNRREHTFQFSAPLTTMVEILATLRRHLDRRGYELVSCGDVIVHRGHER